MTPVKSQRQDSKGRFHPLVRVLAYFLALAAINRIAFAGVATVLPAAPFWLLSLLEGVVYLAGVLLLTWAFCRYLDRKPLVSLGLGKRAWLSHAAVGLGLGGGLIFLVFVVMLAAGWLTAEPSRPSPLPFLASVLSWAALSFVEELTFRGYIMQGLAKTWAMPVAVVVSSLLFGMVHLIDPHVQALAILNICVAGLFFAVAYLVTRSLWLPAGIHIGWNLTEIQVLGFPGSGHTEPSLLTSTVTGPELLTGGTFGPEGGLLVLAACAFGILLLLGYWIASGRKKGRAQQPLA